jgi:hypothetical protein
MRALVHFTRSRVWRTNHGGCSYESTLAIILQYASLAVSLPVEVMRLGVRQGGDALLAGGSGSVVGHGERMRAERVSGK